MGQFLARVRGVVIKFLIQALEAVYCLLPKRSIAYTAGAGIHFLKIANAYQQSIALSTAHRLGIFEHLAKKPSAAHELASALSLNLPSTKILLDCLHDMKYVSVRSGVYSNTFMAMSEFVKGGGFYMGGMLDVVLDQWKCWPDLIKTLRTGDGHPSLSVYSDDNKIYPSYIRACCEMLKHPSELVIKKIDLSGIKRVLAGTVGTTFAREVKIAKPSVELTFACLPHFIKELPELMKDYGMDYKVETVETTPDPESSSWGEKEEYDLIFFARKFAFLDKEEHGVEYLRKAYEVIRPSGLVVLWEPVQENFNGFNWMRNTIALQDAIMGYPQPLYTRKQIREFVREAGFVKVRMINVLYGTMSFTVGVR